MDRPVTIGCLKPCMTYELAVGCSPLTVQGQVAILTVTPAAEHRWLEAELTDGTGALTLIWMGRHRIAGVTPGRSLRVTGLISERGGRRVMFNPGYELLP